MPVLHSYISKLISGSPKHRSCVTLKVSWRRIKLVHITVTCLTLILKTISREMCFRHQERNYRTNLITFPLSKIFSLSSYSQHLQKNTIIVRKASVFFRLLRMASISFHLESRSKSRLKFNSRTIFVC